MRIYSIHPKYLDSKGLVALWRETLLARHVLLGQTKGYTKHPQLNRWKKLTNPVSQLDRYLQEIFLEAENRGFHFEKSKIHWENLPTEYIPLTEGQLQYETEHVKKKLFLRDPKRWKEYEHIPLFDPHPIFTCIPGKIEEWERV